MSLEIDRYWFLTWSTYGTRLPGDARGFVSPVRDESGVEVVHNIVGTPLDARMPNLEKYSRRLLKCEPILLNVNQAFSLLEQFQETAQYRGWRLFAAAIMADHVHVVVGVPGDPEPETLLRDFKSYGSRKLNKNWPTPPSGTWWTESGSRRKLKADENVLATVRYVLDQEFPLVVWTCPAPEMGLPGGIVQASGGR